MSDPRHPTPTVPLPDAAGAMPPAIGRLQRQAARGSAIALANQCVKLIVNLATTVLLAAHLGPADFGLVAVAFAFLSFLMLLRDAGLAGALIRERTITDAHVHSVFWVGVLASVTFAGVLAASAGAVADFYGRPELAIAVRIMTIPLIVQAWGATQEAMLRRSLRFGRLMVADSGSTIAASGVAIVALTLGAGLWSLVLRVAIGPVLSAVACAALYPWRPRFVLSKAALRGLWSFGAFLLLTSLLAFASSRLDSLILAKLLGVAGAGTFFMARNLALTPIQEISGAIGGVMFPVFSEVQHDPAVIRSGYLTGTRGLALLLFPLVAGFIAVGPDAVRLLLGDSWRDTVPVMQIIALQGLLYCLNNPASQVLYALGRSKLQFAYSLAIAATAIGSLVVGARWGVVGAALSWTLGLFLVAPSVLWFASREIGLTIRKALLNIAGPAAAAVGAALTVRVFILAWSAAGAPRGAVLLACEIVLGLGAYAALCGLLLPDALQQMRKTMRASL